MRRLFVRYGTAMASVVLLAFLVPLGLLARTLAEERALDAAREDAQSVAVFVVGADATGPRLAAELLRVNESPRQTTVFLPDGAQLGAPAADTDAVALARLGRALTAHADGGAEVLLPVGGAGEVAVVRTFVPDAELRAGVREAWLVLAAVGLVLLSAAAVAGDRIARRLVRSVSDLAAAADRLGAGDLEVRVEPSGPPEVASVGRVLNGLGSRVKGLLAAERELVADLSHRLRTPITALRLDVDQLGEGDRERMREHVADLVAAVDVVVRSARQPLEQEAVCDAGAVVADRVRFWQILADAEGRAVTTDLPDGSAPVGVAATELGAAVDALVDNVFSHTAEGTGFAVAVLPRPGLVSVVVEDEGPGLDPALAERGRSGTGSSGLGLDVARRTAEAGGGRLVISAGRVGARIVIELPS